MFGRFFIRNYLLQQPTLIIILQCIYKRYIIVTIFITFLCFSCRPERNHVAPLKALKAGSNVKEILNSSSSIQHTNIISFSTHREDVKNELTFAKEVAGVRVRL